MNVVTTADSKFLHCLQGLAKSVRKFYNKQVIVYDFGLTDEEKNSLDAHIIRIEGDLNYDRRSQNLTILYPCGIA